jgi:hypothetical protein
MSDGPKVVATCETRTEAESGLRVLEGKGIAGELRSAGERTEILVPPTDAPDARRALLDDRLQREGRTPQEMSLFMKATLVLTFLAVVTFAILTVTLN